MIFIDLLLLVFFPDWKFDDLTWLDIFAYHVIYLHNTFFTYVINVCYFHYTVSRFYSIFNEMFFKLTLSWF